MLLERLDSPFGMALVGDDALRRQHRRAGARSLRARRHAHHRGADGGDRAARRARSTITGRRTSSRRPTVARLYVSVGSNSNVAENGIDKEAERAAIWEVDPATGRHRVFASGLRNPVGMAWEPETRRALGVGERARRAGERSRARLHDVGARRRVLRLAVQLLRPARRHAAEAAATGPRREGDRARLRARPAHGVARPGVVAGIGGGAARAVQTRDVRRPARLVEPQAAQRLQGDLRAVRERACRRATPVDVLTGFVRDGGDAMGRPVGVAIDGRGALLVADDVGNAVWRVRVRVSARVR